MKKVIVSVVFLIVFISCKQEKKEMSEVTTVEETKVLENDWEILFDGTSLEQWKEFKTNGVSDAWKIEGEALVYTPPTEGEEKKNHDLVTKKSMQILFFPWIGKYLKLVIVESFGV